MSYTITRNALDDEGGPLEAVAMTAAEALKMAQNAAVLGQDLVGIKAASGERYTLAEFAAACAAGTVR